MATAEFSKFARILNVAPSEHHLLGLEIAQLELHHLQGPLDFAFQDIWLWVSNYRLLVIWVMRIFLYGSYVYCHLFLISSASVRSIPFLSCIVPIFARNVPLVSLIFLKRYLLPRECTGHNNHPLPTTQETTLLMDIARWSRPKSDWLHSLQAKMENLYTVSKKKTRS